MRGWPTPSVCRCGVLATDHTDHTDPESQPQITLITQIRRLTTDRVNYAERSSKPFDAEQVISRTRGMIWAARTQLFGIPVSGFDRLVDGAGQMRWKVLGAIPVMTASGVDVSRSAAGRLAWHR